MNINQIKSIRLLELIEANLSQLKEYSYMKDYEDCLSQRDLEDNLFDIMYAIYDYLEIDDRKEEENIAYNLQKEKHYFKERIDVIKEKMYKFSKANEIYNILDKKINKEKCNINCTRMDLNNINNNASIKVNVRYPNLPYTSTSCCNIDIMGSGANIFVRCSQSIHPMIQVKKDYDSYSEETISFKSKCIKGEIELKILDLMYEENIDKIINFVKRCVAESREILKDAK